MPKLTPDVTFREAFDYVTDKGEDSAFEALIALKEEHDEDAWIRFLAFLYEHGPTGKNLGKQFENCDKDVSIWTRDLIARIEEWDTTIWKVD